MAEAQELAPQLSEVLQKVKAGENISMFECLGDDIHVSVNNPYKVINVRRWFKDACGENKPTKEGITVREWE